MNLIKMDEALDEDQVEINGSTYLALFDSGACTSFVSRRLIKKKWGNPLRASEVTAKAFRLINSTTLKTQEVVVYDVRYKGNVEQVEFVEFNVIEDSSEGVFLGAEVARALRRQEETKYSIPVECVFNTKGAGP